MLVKFDNQRENLTELVPLTHPYGGITDGSYVCGRCGDDKTGCALCAGEVRHLVRVRGSY